MEKFRIKQDPGPELPLVFDEKQKSLTVQNNSDEILEERRRRQAEQEREDDRKDREDLIPKWPYKKRRPGTRTRRYGAK